LNLLDVTADFTVPVAQIGPLALESATGDFNPGSASTWTLPSLVLSQVERTL
jgi:hypothetical protein